MLNQTDDFPLYLFQTQFNELQGCSEMVKRYKVPKFFKKDYFDLVIVTHFRSNTKPDLHTAGFS